MQGNRSQASVSFGRRVSYLGINLAIIAIAFGIVLGQSDDDDSILFPGPIGRGRNRNYKQNVPRMAKDDSVLSTSLKIAERMNSIESYEEFLEFVGMIPETKVQIGGRFGGGSEERSNAERAKAATCMPELQTVSLRLDDNPSKFYYPSCTRIKRCGGCCGHSLLSCQPIATETRNFEVIVSELNGDLKTTYRGKEIVPLEEHTKCKCACRIKPEHCSEKQIYVQDECRCVCTNTDEEEKCIAKNHTKLWDKDRCLCLCRETEECSTGFYFDQNVCRCRQVPLLSTIGDVLKNTGYRLGQTQRPDEPPVIVTLDASDPRRKHKDDPEYK